jgi:type I restriction enzyme S subunit
MLTASQKYGVLFQSEFVEREGRRVVEVIMGTESLKHVEPDDFIISMRSFQGGIEWCKLRGSTSFHYVMLKPVKHVHPPYFAHLLKSATYIQALRTTTDLIRDGQELRYSNFVQVDLPVVPLEEQKDIAAFLDYEAAKIDDLVEEQKRLIEILKEKRRAVISHAVTKGLNPSVPMKDSGVEWLGKVPENWGVKRFRDVCASISTGPFGTALGSEDYIDGGVPVINPSHIVGNKIVPDDAVSVSSETADRLSFWELRAGDIVVARRGELGRAAVVGAESDGWICGTGSLRVTPNMAVAAADFLHAVLQSTYAREWLNQSSVGSTMANLNEGILGRLPIALPDDTAEQTQLTNSLFKQLSEIVEVEILAEECVARLQERRTALISAAVTGKIDVRSKVQQREPAPA